MRRTRRRRQVHVTYRGQRNARFRQETYAYLVWCARQANRYRLRQSREFYPPEERIHYFGTLEIEDLDTSFLNDPACIVTFLNTPLILRKS